MWNELRAEVCKTLYLWHKAPGTAYQGEGRVLDPAPLNQEGKLWTDGAGLATLPLDSIMIPPMKTGNPIVHLFWAGEDVSPWYTHSAVYGLCRLHH